MYFGANASRSLEKNILTSENVVVGKHFKGLWKTKFTFQ